MLNFAFYSNYKFIIIGGGGGSGNNGICVEVVLFNFPSLLLLS